MPEIERKYQLKFVPGDLQVLPVSLVEQGYLFTSEGELRLRRVDEPDGLSAFYLTAKSEGDIERAEWEIETPRWVFESLWPKVKGSVRKMRSFPSVDRMGVEYNVDVYLDKLDGLIILEVEFQTREMAEEYYWLPLWAAINAREVTGDPLYKNKHLAQATDEEITTILRW